MKLVRIDINLERKENVGMLAWGLDWTENQ